MRRRLLIQLAQAGLRGLAYTADFIDEQLKDAFDEIGLPAPERTRGQIFAATMRRYATRPDRRLPKGAGP
jgi:hypothetical protein